MKRYLYGFIALIIFNSCVSIDLIKPIKNSGNFTATWSIASNKHDIIIKWTKSAVAQGDTAIYYLGMMGRIIPLPYSATNQYTYILDTGGVVYPMVGFHEDGQIIAKNKAGYTNVAPFSIDTILYY